MQFHAKVHVYVRVCVCTYVREKSTHAKFTPVDMYTCTTHTHVSFICKWPTRIRPIQLRARARTCAHNRRRGMRMKSRIERDESREKDLKWNGGKGRKNEIERAGVRSIVKAARHPPPRDSSRPFIKLHPLILGISFRVFSISPREWHRIFFYEIIFIHILYNYIYISRIFLFLFLSFLFFHLTSDYSDDVGEF